MVLKRSFGGFCLGFIESRGYIIKRFVKRVVMIFSALLNYLSDGSDGSDEMNAKDPWDL